MPEKSDTSDAMSKKKRRDGSKERIRPKHHPSSQALNQIHRIRAICRLNEKNRMRDYSKYSNRSPDIREDKDRYKISSSHTSSSRSKSREKSRCRSTSKRKERSRDERTEKISRPKSLCRSHNRENKKSSIQPRCKPSTNRESSPRDDIGSNLQDRRTARHRKCPNVTACSSTDLDVSHSTATISTNAENENGINRKSYHQSVNIPKYFQEVHLLREKVDAKINNHLADPPSELQSGKEWVTFLTSNCHSIVTAPEEGSDLQPDTGLDHIWEKFIRNKYEREFKEQCHYLMLQSKIDYGDIKQWRKESNSEKETETVVNCLPNDNQNDILVAAPPPLKNVDPSSTQIKQTITNDYACNKLGEQYQLAQKPFDIQQWRKEENSEKETQTLVNRLSNERKIDIMVTAAPPSPKGVDPTEIKMTNTKDYIGNKLREQYQLAQKPFDEQTILIQTEEIYNKKRKIFESNHPSEALDQSTLLPEQDVSNSLTLNDVFNISRNHSQQVRGQSDRTENCQHKNSLDLENVNWNNISNAIGNINSDSNVNSADEQGKGVSWNDVGPIY